MKKLILALFVLSNLSFINSQWVANYGFKSGDVNFASSKGNAVVCEGNFSYVTGYTQESATGNDIVTIKYNSQGDTVWVRSYNGTANSDDEGLGICIDDNDNIYVTGYAQNTGRSKDAVILKYSKQGNLLWARSFSVTTNAVVDKGVAIAVDNRDDIYVTGYTTGTDGNTDIFTMKIDRSGDILWTAIEDGSSNLNAEGTSIAIDKDRNVLVCGFITASGTNTDIAVIKYSRNGVQRWMKTVDGGAARRIKHGAL
ncbi:MAG: PKD repeat protein [Chlorobi bacterium OLB5]|nr:MAG: PKD repeat protein [Chlorobi bacterium OLB5]